MLFIAHDYMSLDIFQLLSVYRGSMQSTRKEEEFLAYLHDDFFRQSDAAYYLWLEDGHYVAALRLEPYDDGLLLSGLETAPEKRRQGYASMLLNQVLRNECDRVIYSHVYQNNIPSLKLHMKCGFTKHLDFAKFIDGTVSSNALTLIYSRK